MEQDCGGGGGRGGGDGRRGEMNKQVHNHPQPQKCPRCDSFNTKFCYYNNYSLSQPRFFCKTCRRYWTQGGTLRNVPVGGGCRKGKRAKNSVMSSSSNSIGNSSLAHAQSALHQSTDHQSTMAALARDSSSVLASFSSTVPFYPGGVGYMSSFAAFNPSLNPNLSPHNFNPSLNVGGVGVGVGSSNLGLLQGFNVAAAAALGNSSQGQNRPSQFFHQMGGNCGPVFTSEQQGLNLIPQSNMVNSSSVSGSGSGPASDNWPQTYINNANNNRLSEQQSLWSTVSTTSIGANCDRNGGGVAGSGGDGVSVSLGPNQWPDLSGFNPHQ
ncbi:dof zinc finger protein 3 [Lathyrus oleraceus]|uniref:Dof zinc finger protein n=1 Tax=Pisum sativum TaxID=3888 RepID=A0A9D5H0Q6_PEA|nr:dof zinc finger protein 3-like [Pisum sativum]KAI5447977.1 hypothetical protein KIW84_015422 [Pisum sativum]